MSELLEWLLSGICHQMSHHSLQVTGGALPLCARCTGMYLAANWGIVVLVGILRRGRMALPRGATAAVLAAMLALWALDGLNSAWEYLSGGGLLYTPSNTLRWLTGAMAGSALLCLAFELAAPLWLWQTVIGLSVVAVFALVNTVLLFHLKLIGRLRPVWRLAAGTAAGVLELAALALVRLVFSLWGFAY
ncbi:MAG: DUF2085 domain-containing protein [Chloroflexi bacterium]|nr:DUF2085 domain-containing protein [Chloroflexota bacterium]